MNVTFVIFINNCKSNNKNIKGYKSDKSNSFFTSFIFSCLLFTNNCFLYPIILLLAANR